LHICEEDEPLVACALFELSGGFCATYATGWVLAADACSRFSMDLDWG
jgi:hypothetical protein